MKSPPQNLEAERITLGSVLLDNSVLDELLKIVQPNYYHDRRNQTIVSECVALHESGEIIDLVVLIQHLRETGKLERAGGVEYVTSLLEATPTVAGIENYARIIRKLAGKREDIEFAKNLYHDRSNGLDAGEFRRLLIEQADRVVERERSEDILASLPTLGEFADRFAAPLGVGPQILRFSPFGPHFATS